VQAIEREVGGDQLDVNLDSRAMNAAGRTADTGMDSGGAFFARGAARSRLPPGCPKAPACIDYTGFADAVQHPAATDSFVNDARMDSWLTKLRASI
jgi:hypothetical protein